MTQPPPTTAIVVTPETAGAIKITGAFKSGVYGPTVTIGTAPPLGATNF